MFSNAYLPVIPQPATRIATSTVAALILVALSQPSGASQPHWSSRIGTGQALVTGSERQQPRAAFASASAHWTARIGTGRAIAESGSTPVTHSTGVPGPTHESAKIGTGHASTGTDVRKLAERKGPAEARAIVEPLGDHPAVRVAQRWSSRGIDPNTFIVLHPAGPIWVDTSSTATATASASNK